MKRVVTKFITQLIILFSIVSAQLVFSETTEKEPFPKDIIVEDADEKLSLSMTGTAVRKKFFLKIYSMAHYIERELYSFSNNEEIYSNIMTEPGTKQISMMFLRSLTAKQIQDSLITGLKLNTTDEEYLQILPNVEIFIEAINADVKENDQFAIRWHSDGRIVSLFQGKKISSIKDENFAKALWSIWFGSFSVVNRDLLVKELLTSS